MIVYKAVNKINGKIYVGQTCKTLDERKSVHFKKARGGVRTHFYDAIRKYGEDAFEFSVICVADTKEDLNLLETYYIQKYNSIKCGYNMVDGGDNNVMSIESVYNKHRLRMQSDDVRKKLSDTMRRKIAEGKFFTEEHRKRLSESAKGNHNFGNGDTRSIGCYCITEECEELHFHSYRDAWKWWSSTDNVFSTNAECVYQRKIKQSIKDGYYTYGHPSIRYEYPKWYKELGGDVDETVADS